MEEFPIAAAFGCDAATAPQARAALEDSLRALHTRWRGDARGWTVSLDEFARSAGRSTAVRAAVLQRHDVSDAALAEVALAAAVRLGITAAVTMFETRYLQSLDVALGRMKLSSSQLDEVLQHLRERLLLPDEVGILRLEQYAGEGRLEGLVRVAATRIAVDHLRADRPQTQTPLDGSSLAVIADDPALAALKSQQKKAFGEALAIAVQGLDQRGRNLLRLHLLGGVTLEQLAAMYQVHRATVVRWLADARATVLKNTQKELQSRLGISGRELESILTLVQSRLDLSIERLFRTRNDADEPSR